MHGLAEVGEGPALELRECTVVQHQPFQDHEPLCMTGPA